ncbi:sugar phosphate isomerase/epimerase family protein [Paenibacillus sp. UNC451MF]|uniref:sugar phosphate isomerase/epimerase family protein n=1 Tax=Paenibacillus sp. UNC451MF TaxID=1449063 RepID=UPI0006904FA0|nr:sugar phosphate isomerase/epimerase family protein [Paenibacillus sp. UNC451MF]
MSSVEPNEEVSKHVYEHIPTSHYLRDIPKGPYYKGDFKLGLNFYSFSHNLNSWINGSTEGAPPIDTMQVIRFAKEAGFDAVDITSYYIPGYDNMTMPTRPDEEIFEYARNIKKLCTELGIAISGTGVKNDFADPNEERRLLDIKRTKYWIDVAAEMGAPVMRVFNGAVPKDIEQLGWEAIARDRIVPALKECAEYGASKGVIIGMQNHGDMVCTADQVIRILNWVDHPNIGLINDTGFFKKFMHPTGLNYAWYDDIEAVLPYTVNFQVKRKPAGSNTDQLIDLEELFRRIRGSNYRGYIPIETLWVNGDENHPQQLSEPPYEQVKQFLAQLRAASESTK